MWELEFIEIVLSLVGKRKVVIKREKVGFISKMTLIAIILICLIGSRFGVNADATGGTGSSPAPLPPVPDPSPSPAPLPPGPDPSPSPAPLPPSAPSPSVVTSGGTGGGTGIPTTTGEGTTSGSKDGYNKYDYFGNFGTWLKEHFFIWWQGLLIGLAMLFVLMVVVWACFSCCIFRVTFRPKKPTKPYELLVGKVGDKK